ncbi:MAG: hypothetical protein KatS3mg115_1646 [Candidatus Poribacteria bacterium]|nr:MAG: hypothetical protein KatS3mg115_1646 [Candidatus Poribacteria bacterium]
MAKGARQIILAEVDKIGGTSTFNVRRVNWIQLDDGRWVPNPSREFLTLDDLDRIERFCPSVESASPEMGAGVRLESVGGSKGAQMIATSPAYRLIRNWAAEIGRFLEESDTSLWSKVAVIGAEVAKDLCRWDRPDRPRDSD